MIFRQTVKNYCDFNSKKNCENATVKNLLNG